LETETTTKDIMFGSLKPLKLNDFLSFIKVKLKPFLLRRPFPF